MNNPLLGAVLAGGPGSRLGGGKPQALVGGRRLLDIALANLAQVCGQVAVAGGDPARVPAGVRHIADRWPGQGPLGALASVLLATDAPAVLLLAVDLPLVRRPLLERMAQGDPEALAVAPLGPGGVEPLVGWYRRECLPHCLRQIERDEWRIRHLLPQLGARLVTRREVAALDPEDLSFLNVNYPEDLARARQLAQERGL